MTRTGIWLIGIYGNGATTATVGARALSTRETDTVGLVTAREPCTSIDLPKIEDFVFSGHNIAATSILSTARLLSKSGTPSPKTVRVV